LHFDNTQILSAKVTKITKCVVPYTFMAHGYSNTRGKGQLLQVMFSKYNFLIGFN